MCVGVDVGCVPAVLPVIVCVIVLLLLSSCGAFVVVVVLRSCVAQASRDSSVVACAIRTVLHCCVVRAVVHRCVVRALLYNSVDGRFSGMAIA